MSFNVLVIPEDFRQDEHLLKPIVERLVDECRKQARVRVCRDPLLGGIDQALKWPRIREIVDRYQGMVDCFLLIVDRDGDANRRRCLDQLEQHARDHLGSDRLFLAENAWQEIEVWVLAAMSDLPNDWTWAEVRREPNAKEVYFEPYAELRGVVTHPFGGRQVLGQEAARSYPRIRRLSLPPPPIAERG